MNPPRFSTFDGQANPYRVQTDLCMPPTQGSRGAANPGLSKHAPSGQSLGNVDSRVPIVQPQRHAFLSPVVTRRHPSSPVIARCHPLPPIVARRHLVVSIAHHSSPPPDPSTPPRAQTPPPPTAYLEEVLFHSPGFAAPRLPWVTSPPSTPEPCRGSLNGRFSRDRRPCVSR